MFLWFFFRVCNIHFNSLRSIYKSTHYIIIMYRRVSYKNNWEIWERGYVCVCLYVCLVLGWWMKTSYFSCKSPQYGLRFSIAKKKRVNIASTEYEWMNNLCLKCFRKSKNDFRTRNACDQCTNWANNLYTK